MSSRNSSPLGATIPQIADFLVYLLWDKDLALSAIKGYLSALNHVLPSREWIFPPLRGSPCWPKVLWNLALTPGHSLAPTSQKQCWRTRVAQKKAKLAIPSPPPGVLMVSVPFFSWSLLSSLLSSYDLLCFSCVATIPSDSLIDLMEAIVNHFIKWSLETY